MSIVLLRRIPLNQHKRALCGLVKQIVRLVQPCTEPIYSGTEYSWELWPSRSDFCQRLTGLRTRLRGNGEARSLQEGGGRLGSGVQVCPKGLQGWNCPGAIIPPTGLPPGGKWRHRPKLVCQTKNSGRRRIAYGQTETSNKTSDPM